MIVVDTSAVIAILFAEPERQTFLKAITSHETAISAANVVECFRVVGNRTPRLRSRIALLLKSTETEIVSVDEGQIRFAEEGHARFGKGGGRPPAVLNFGDLFAYALARHLDAPLLFKGDDFAQTDVRVALAG